MLAICVADMSVVFKAPKTSSKAESVSQGTKPGAKPGHKKLLTSSKQPSVSSKEATKGGSSKAPTSSKTGHSKKRKESSSAMDSNPSQPPVSTHVDTEMHKEDQQATSGPTSLEVISEARANPQLSSGMSAFNLNKPIYSASFIIHSKSVSGNDASAISTAEADPGKSSPRNFVPQQQCMNEGTKKLYMITYLQVPTHMLLQTKPYMLVKGWKLSSLNLEQEKGPAPLLDKLRKKKPPAQSNDPVIVVDDSDEDEEDEVHTTTEDTSVSKSSSPSSKPSFPQVDNSVSLLNLKKKDLKKFDFVTKDGERVHLTKEQISAQKKIKEEAKAKAARHESEMRKEELIDLLGPEVVNKYYNDKL
ncbi:hypothetical protein Tco_0432796 [Tanacetum coccineum]